MKNFKIIFALIAVFVCSFLPVYAKKHKKKTYKLKYLNLD